MLEDMLKGLLGIALLYNSYFMSYFMAFGLKGNEMALDFGCGGALAQGASLIFLIKVDVSRVSIYHTTG